MLKGLVCPHCLGTLKKATWRLVCQKCREVYSTKKGILLMWRPEFEKKAKRRVNQDLSFSRKYVEAINKGKCQQLFGGEEEFFERETRKSLAARMVDKKALDTLKHLVNIDFHGLRVLDIGAGGGKEAVWLFSQGVKEICCLDISYDFLSLAKKRLRNKPVSFVVANAEKLPFTNNSFDLAFFMGTLHHIVDHQKALAEVARVAKRIALVGEPVRMKFFHKVLNFIHWNTEYGGLKTKRFDPEKIRDFLENKDFEVRIKTNFIWYPFPLLRCFKNNRQFLQIYFKLLAVLDKLFGRWGHDLTVFARRKT